MDGKEAIIKKITDDAEKKASSIIDNAKFEGGLLIKDAEKWASDYINVQRDLLKNQQQEIISRRKTVAELDVRKIFLQKKQELISKILDSIYLKMTKLDKKQYLSFVEKKIEAYCDDFDEIVLSSDNVLSKEDIESLPVFTKHKLLIANKKGDFIGGVYLNGHKSDKDLTFKSIVQSNKDYLIPSIAEKLFN